MAGEKILIVEDEKLIRMTLRERLVREGYFVAEADCGLSALDQLDSDETDLVLLDYRLPDINGIDVLRQVRERHPQTNVILMTAYSSIDDAIEAIKLGAYDYLRKPVDHDDLLVTIGKALETTRLRREVRRLRDEQKRLSGVGSLVGRSRPMQDVFDRIGKVAESGTSTVLIQGASGTGKDLVAKAIHYGSSRADKPFMNITCSALPEALLESELFGHERGAFTDAKHQKKGLLELADGGSVFLDEIGDMGLKLQAKLLRFLEEKAFKRLGGVNDLAVDVRIIAATNRELEKAVGEGAFREDLYYRLNVVPIFLPPLSRRKGDIPDLVHFFLDAFNKEFNKNTQRLTPEALSCLVRYDWPGNVRELRNVIERMMILENKPELDVTDLPEEIVHRPVNGNGSGTGVGCGIEIPEGGLSLREVERELVQQALARTDGNQSRAARLLHISRDALRYKMKKFGLQ
jgi:DNA-binding NtrC family response regulator